MKEFRVFTVNPGSTSTKVALFEGERKVFSVNVQHGSSLPEKGASREELLDARIESIEELLAAEGIDLTGIDACVGRGGGLLSLEGGTYAVDALVLDHSLHQKNGVNHPAGFGPSIARYFADKYGARAFTVNPPDVDELWDVARVTGIRGLYREVHLHALNLKETAIRHAASQGLRYEDQNYIVCHIGGGISVSAHKKGRMIDGFDIVGGDGPMAPTRCGGMTVAGILTYLKDHDGSELRAMCTKSGGFMSHFGTADALEITERAKAGDEYADLVWNAMIYQIAKCIGAMASALSGRVDGILLGGGLVHSTELVEKIRESCGYIAPVSAYPGEFEMEAMAQGAVRVLLGQEECKTYTGKKVFEGFPFA